MGDIKTLASKLANRIIESKPHKSPRTLSINHNDYLLLLAYCKRKNLVLGDVISDLMQMLIRELMVSGELTLEDQNKADEYEKTRVKRTVITKVK